MKTYDVHTNFGVIEITASDVEDAKDEVRKVHRHRLIIYKVEEHVGPTVENTLCELFTELFNLMPLGRK
jgi:hypothetical protein